MLIILLILVSTTFSQVVNFEESSIQSEIAPNVRGLGIDTDSIGEPISKKLDFNSIVVDNKTYLESVINLETIETIQMRINHDELPSGSKFFLFDIDSIDNAGPFYAKGSYSILGPIHASNILIQCVIPIPDYNEPYEFTLEKTDDLSLISTSPEIIYRKKRANTRENPIIVVTGFWPPTNEMIRHFSQDQSLNPNGWMGENWQETGYDIISFFPEFEDPNCNSCGQGFGDFEVDYQDTSVDFWEIVGAINPITIITFSRGYIDYSWELEYNYYNRTNWGGDYATPYYPTPNPPDSSEPINHLRNSTLPMEMIMDAINGADIGLNSYMDLNGDPGHFVSEFMGYHGVWYHDLYQFNEIHPCYLAGHVHVGGLIDWDTAKEAAEITIMEVIESLEEFIYIPGDVNDDMNIDILDLVVTAGYILGEVELDGGSFYAADMNSDTIINIQDIILIINLIL